jgi:hypothetical protein
MVVFFPWYRYGKLELDKKQTVLDENRKWNCLFRSVVVNGFINNNDNVPMWAASEPGEQLKATTTTVADYLISKVHPHYWQQDV